MADKHDSLETVKQDTADLADEAMERAKAGGERVNRAVQGDAMPLGDRVASNVKEAGHNLKADFDKSKRDVRDNT
jgi:hypothetical protein